MLKTRAISAEKRPRGGLSKRRFGSSALLLLFLVFAAFFATAQRALADTGMPDPGAIEATVDPGMQAPPVSPTVSQDAGTDQAATADASLVHPEQSNTIESAPTDSSGALNATQENDAAVAGAAANGASTGQEAGGGSTAAAPPSDTDQQAATDQAANAAAAAVQPQQTNVVIIIRVNSPGDDVISQTNTVSVVGVAANQGSTDQHQGSTTQDPTPAGASASGTSDPTQSPAAGGSTPPTDGQPQPSGAVPQSAQSANAAKQLVQPLGAVQGQRPHAARALSILASSGGSNGKPPASEHQQGSAPRPNGDGVGSVSPAIAATASGSPVAEPNATPVSTSGSVGHHAAAPVARGQKSEPLRHRFADWLRGGAQAALPPDAGSGTRSFWAMLGLMTLAALLAGGLAWAALTRMPSVRGVARFPFGRW